MPNSSLDIKTNLELVRQRVDSAAARAGRDPKAITLIAVSKTKPWQMVACAIAHEQKDFGENTIQDALTKIPNTRNQSDIHWHFIGPLQSNKTKHVPGNFQWLHTLESEKIAQRLENTCAEIGKILSVLVQVNIANDPAKKGLKTDALDAFVDALLIQQLQYIKLRGLMTIGAVDADEPTRRSWFAGLRELQKDIAGKFNLPDFNQLSMGMSDDFEEAIEEGATMVRVGSTIFGKRDVKV